VLVPGCAEFIQFLGVETVPARYKDRKIVPHNPQATGIGLLPEEMQMLAQAVASKLNASCGPVSVVIPSKGFSDLNNLGEPFYDSNSNRLFTEALKKSLMGGVRVKESEAHINDHRFAEEVLEVFEDLVGGAGR